MKNTPALDKDQCPTVYLFAAQLDWRSGPLWIKNKKRQKQAWQEHGSSNTLYHHISRMFTIEMEINYILQADTYMYLTGFCYIFLLLSLI